MTAPRPRPLSPHLQIYRPSITMMMSIAHRISGAALYFGSLLLVLYLVMLAGGEASFALMHDAMGSLFGRLILFAFTFALFHHMLGGMRHLIWDTGLGLEPGRRQQMALFTLVGSMGLTLLTWLVALATGL